MIELPEAEIIAGQMNSTLGGKKVISVMKGDTPHKFAFFNKAIADYGSILNNKQLGLTRSHGNAILTSIGLDHTLVLGGGGERILNHEEEKSIPKKHQLLLGFQDRTFLTVTIQGWGNVLLLPNDELETHPHVKLDQFTPLSKEFTFDYLKTLFNNLEVTDTRSIKFFIISQPGIWGIGNGYLQEILFHTGIHPKRKAVDLNIDEINKLYSAILNTVKKAIELGGRDNERDLFNKPGQFSRLMDSKTVGNPCPVCGTLIQKIQYLGGACYLCPICQT